MTYLAEPPPLDPLDLFGRHSPIEPVFMDQLLENLLPTLPTYAAADEQRQADIRLATMHALAAFMPADPLEAMLAADILSLRARAQECFRLAAQPDTVPSDGFRYVAQANSLQRNAQHLLRLLQRTQTARRKAADQPSERAGYWFFDAAAHIEPSQRNRTPPRTAHSPGMKRTTLHPSHPPRAAQGRPRNTSASTSPSKTTKRLPRQRRTTDITHTTTIPQTRPAGRSTTRPMRATRSPASPPAASTPISPSRTPGRRPKQTPAQTRRGAPAHRRAVRRTPCREARIIG